MKQAENMPETLNKDFSDLTEENRKKVIDMIKFLVLTQNTIVPEMLNASQKEERKEGNILSQR